MHNFRLWVNPKTCSVINDLICVSGEELTGPTVPSSDVSCSCPVDYTWLDLVSLRDSEGEGRIFDVVGSLIMRKKCVCLHIVTPVGPLVQRKFKIPD